MRRKIPMKTILTLVVLTLGLSSPAFAQNGHGQNGNGQNGNGQNGQNGNGQNGQDRDHDPRGAPAPLIGAGISGFAVGMGYGVYWLVRRRRNVG
jgi:hypothetical protein